VDVINQQRLFLEAQSNTLAGPKTCYATLLELECDWKASQGANTLSVLTITFSTAAYPKSR